MSALTRSPAAEIAAHRRHRIQPGETHPGRCDLEIGSAAQSLSTGCGQWIAQGLCGAGF